MAFLIISVSAFDHRVKTLLTHCSARGDVPLVTMKRDREHSKTRDFSLRQKKTHLIAHEETPDGLFENPMFAYRKRINDHK